MWPKPHLETTKTPLWPMDARGLDCKVFFKDPWGGKPLSPHVTCSPAIAGTSAIAEEIWTFTRVLPTQPELCWLLVISLCVETRSARIDYIGFLVIKNWGFGVASVGGFQDVSKILTFLHSQQSWINLLTQLWCFFFAKAEVPLELNPGVLIDLFKISVRLVTSQIRRKLP